MISDRYVETVFNMIEGRDLILLEKLCITKPFIIKKNDYLNNVKLCERLRFASDLDLDFVIVEYQGLKVLDVKKSFNGVPHFTDNYVVAQNNDRFIHLLDLLVNGSYSLVVIVDSERNVRGVLSKSDLSKHTFVSRVYMSLMYLENLAYFYVSVFLENGARDCLKRYNNHFDRKGEKLSKLEDVGLQPMLEFIAVTMLVRDKCDYEFFNDLNSVNLRVRDIIELRNSVAHPKLFGDSRLVFNAVFIKEFSYVEAASRDLYKVMEGDARFTTWYQRHFSVG